MPPDLGARVARLLLPDAVARPLTDEAIVDAERLLGVTLPGDLLSLLRRQNGGYVHRDFATCPTSRPTSWADDHVPVKEIAGIGSTHVLSLLDSPQLNAEWQQPSELILFSGDGHWWLALDYRDCGPHGEPPVLFFENDSDGSPDELVLASSFREFICLLEPEPEPDVVLRPRQVKSVWIDPDFAREHGLDVPEHE